LIGIYLRKRGAKDCTLPCFDCALSGLMIVADDVKIREVKTFNGSDCWFAMAKTPKAMFSRSNKENEHRGRGE
jgi:hypothetical protein